MLMLTKVEFSWNENNEFEYQLKQIAINLAYIISAYDFTTTDPEIKETGIHTVIICADYNQYYVQEAINEIWKSE